MASENFTHLNPGLNLVPNATTKVAVPGDIDYSTDTGNFNLFTGSGATTISTASSVQTLTNKTIDAGSNTITGLTNSNLSGSALISNANLATMSNNTIKGNVSGITAVPSDLTATQATSILNVFSSGLKGLVPASGGGTTNFLRADGTFAVPPGAGSGVTTIGTIDSQTASTDGAVIVSTNLYMQSASASKPGLVNNLSQTLSGSKTFQTSINTPQINDNSAGLSINSSGLQNINITPGQFLFLTASLGTQLQKISTPGTNPGVSYLSIYAKSDNNVYTLTSGGVETQLASSGGFPSAIGAYVYYASGSSFSATNGNPIKFDTTVEDTNSAYSASTGRYTVPSTGRYIITAGITASGTPFIYLAKNGTLVGTNLFDVGTSGNGSVVLSLTSGDTIAVTPDRSASVSSQASYFSIYKIGN